MIKYCINCDDSVNDKCGKDGHEINMNSECVFSGEEEANGPKNSTNQQG